MKALQTAFVEEFPFVTKKAVQRAADEMAVKQAPGDGKKPVWSIQPAHAALVDAAVDDSTIAKLHEDWKRVAVKSASAAASGSFAPLFLLFLDSLLTGLVVTFRRQKQLRPVSRRAVANAGPGRRQGRHQRR